MLNNCTADVSKIKKNIQGNAIFIFDVFTVNVTSKNVKMWLFLQISNIVEKPAFFQNEGAVELCGNISRLKCSLHSLKL